MDRKERYEDIIRRVLDGKITGEYTSKQLLKEYFYNDNNLTEEIKARFHVGKGVLSIFAGVTMLLSTTSVALAKDNVLYPKSVSLKTLTKIEVQVENDSNDATMVVSEDYFAEPDYSGYFDKSLCGGIANSYLRKYVNDAGEEKYFPCENTHVDDYKRTDDIRLVDDEEYKTLILENKWDIVTPHASIFFNPQTYAKIPIYSNENIVDNAFYRLWGIRFLDEEKCEILYKTGLERAVDNFGYVQYAINKMKDQTSDIYIYQYLVLLSPVVVNEDTLICQHMIIDKKDFSVEAIQNMLMYPTFLYITEKEKMYIESKAQYVSFPMEKTYQQTIIVPKVK